MTTTNDTPTPGQVAYAAWCADILGPQRPPNYAPWDALHPNQRTAWEAAAQAVRAHIQEDILRLVMTPVERAHWDAAAQAVRAQTATAAGVAGDVLREDARGDDAAVPGSRV